MSRQATAKWRNMFERGHTDMDYAEREGRPTTSTNYEIAARVNELILANRPVEEDKIANKLDISHGSVRNNTVGYQLDPNLLVIGHWTEILRRGHRKTYATPRLVF
ncbi:hypothetical protein AVEN_134017-1 [Araneus ventricosus]|uniref:Mos1 transposase HTH domain-containing protein n=1 Tax=Araneus ventricosus TaxID=182803 RepID=A0A4Y2U6G0_ARAVE|nr:hypothetical protein AVEN_134017-1 [Araneus ventricosus]